jgi:hypothetical protein
MQIVIEHNWMIAGPGGHYGLLQFQSGPGWLEANTGVSLGPVSFNIPLPIFAVVAIVSVTVILATLLSHAHRMSHHNEA